MKPSIGHLLYLGELSEIKVVLNARQREALTVFDCSVLTHPEEILTAWIDLFELPNYYGRNWDALEECLSDLDWLHRDVFFVLGNAQILRAISEEKFRLIVQILGQMGTDSWSESPHPWSCEVCFHAIDEVAIKDLLEIFGDGGL